MTTTFNIVLLIPQGSILCIAFAFLEHSMKEGRPAFPLNHCPVIHSERALKQLALNGMSLSPTPPLLQGSGTYAEEEAEAERL